MSKYLELRREDYLISTDPARLDIDAIAEMLGRSYWAATRPRKNLERALRNSLVFGMYDPSGQIGLARVVTDFGVVAYLCDVFIHEDFRGNGLGKWMLEIIHAHPDLKDLHRWLLVTSDAHSLYDQYGWTPLSNPEQWMEKLND
jgi:GNAT superfamily N-acetyltransferase